MSRTLAGYIIATGLAVGSLRAQDVTQVERRVDSLRAEAARANRAILEYRRAHPAHFNFSDSAIVGAGMVKVYFDERFAAKVRAGVEEADRHLSELGAALRLLDTTEIFSVTAESSFNAYDQRYGRATELSVRHHPKGDPKNPARTWVEGDPQSIAYVIVRSVSEAISWKHRSALTSWTSGPPPIAPSLEARQDWGAMRLTMVSSPSHFGRSCFLGDIRACRVYLGLDTVADPVHDLFDATGRRLRVQYDEERARFASRVATDRCLAGNDDACVAVLNLIGGVTVLSSPYIRNALVIDAISLGKSRGPERMLLASGTAGDAIAAAARQPLDSVVADWQRHVSARSGTAGSLTATLAVSSLVWIGICVFFALRSSRWR